MTKALVGYTGFVGSNLNASSQFDALYNSKNIKEAYGTKPDLLIYAGVRAEKFLANSYPEKDKILISEAQKNIKNIAPRNLVLISTIDVFKNPVAVNEDSQIDIEGLQPYGLHRYALETWVRQNYEDCLIVRLPGLFGKNIKKNFLYDMINIIPSMLNEKKFLELTDRVSELKLYYKRQENGFWKLTAEDCARSKLKKIFTEMGFSALNFTDSRSVFQFYNLANLWHDIEICLQNNIKLWHAATEPISAAEIYEYVTGKVFINELSGLPAYYDFRTKYCEFFNGIKGYICNKQLILHQIQQLMEGR